jgi:hypothetical protein
MIVVALLTGVCAVVVPIVRGWNAEVKRLERTSQQKFEYRRHRPPKSLAPAVREDG